MVDALVLTFGPALASPQFLLPWHVSSAALRLPCRHNDVLGERKNETEDAIQFSLLFSFLPLTIFKLMFIHRGEKKKEQRTEFNERQHIAASLRARLSTTSIAKDSTRAGRGPLLV